MGEEEKKTMELSIVVTPGSVVQNFEDYKAMVKAQIADRYSNIEVSEENLKDARAARARLNAAKKVLADVMKSAQKENDAVLEVPKKQAAELTQILDEAVQTLDTQIKNIEEAQRKDKLAEAQKIKEEILATATEEVAEFARGCGWVDNEKWGNKTFLDSQIRKEVKASLETINSALLLLTGEFAPQMLASFKADGDLSKAQLLGVRMKRQKEEYEEAQRRKKEAEERASRPVTPPPAPAPAPKVEPVQEEPAEAEAEEQQDNTAEVVEEAVTTIPSPASYVKNRNSYEKGFICLKLSCARYQYEFIMDVMKRFGIKAERIKEAK